MPNRISGFRTPEDAVRYYELYDRLAESWWPVPRQELDVPTRVGSTHVRRSGPDRGVPFVLVHPTTASSLAWYRLVAPLAEDHPVYALDTIGTAGRSVQTQPVRSVDDLVAWLDETLDALGLDRVHLVGYSEGGWLAGSHAALTARPDRLASLNLIEPGGAIARIRRRVLAAMLWRGARVLRAKDKRRALRDFNTWLNGDLELTEEEIDYALAVFRSFRQRLPRPDRLADDELRRIAVPTLVFLGGRTRLYDTAEVEARARRVLPDVTIDLIPDAGHGLGFQFPEHVADRILRFAADHEDTPASAP